MQNRFNALNLVDEADSGGGSFPLNIPSDFLNVLGPKQRIGPINVFKPLGHKEQNNLLFSKGSKRALIRKNLKPSFNLKPGLKQTWKEVVEDPKVSYSCSLNSDLAEAISDFSDDGSSKSANFK